MYFTNETFIYIAECFLCVIHQLTSSSLDSYTLLDSKVSITEHNETNCLQITTQ